jgi:hypothetical protein
VGEDHALPAPDWCTAVLRAHREHPEAPVVAGCLLNGTRSTIAGRANFLAFAAPFTPPMRTLDRPPPVSMLSFKRDALLGVSSAAGAFETDLLPRWFAEGAMVVDDRIVLVHYQDHGVRWALVNAFRNTRANYGYAGSLKPGTRKAEIKGIVTRLFLRQWREAWASRQEFNGLATAVVTAAVCLSTTAGAFTGALLGPGRAAELVA